MCESRRSSGTPAARHLHSEVLIVWWDDDPRRRRLIRAKAASLWERAGERVLDGFLDPVTNEVILLLCCAGGTQRIVGLGAGQRTLVAAPAFDQTVEPVVLTDALRRLAESAEDATLEFQEDWAWRIDDYHEVSRVMRLRERVASRRARN